MSDDCPVRGETPNEEWVTPHKGMQSCDKEKEDEKQTPKVKKRREEL